MVAVGDKFPDANLHDQFPPDFKVRRRPLNPPSIRAIPGTEKRTIKNRVAIPPRSTRSSPPRTLRGHADLIASPHDPFTTQVNTTSRLAGKKTIVVGLPGAFTPT